MQAECSGSVVFISLNDFILVCCNHYLRNNRSNLKLKPFKKTISLVHQKPFFCNLILAKFAEFRLFVSEEKPQQKHL